jgi:hypothetical protein
MSVLSHTQVFKRLKRFKEGREEIEDDPHFGMPCTSKTELTLKELLPEYSSSSN